MADIQHENISDSADIHEPKQVAGADTTDAGKIITPSSGSDGIGVLRELKLTELDSASATSGSVPESDGSGGTDVVAPQHLYAGVIDASGAGGGAGSWSASSDSTMSSSVTGSAVEVTFAVSGMYYISQAVTDSSSPGAGFTVENKIQSKTSGDTETFNGRSSGTDQTDRLVIYRISA